MFKNGFTFKVVKTILSARLMELQQPVFIAWCFIIMEVFTIVRMFTREQ